MDEYLFTYSVIIKINYLKKNEIIEEKFNKFRNIFNSKENSEKNINFLNQIAKKLSIMCMEKINKNLFYSPEKFGIFLDPNNNHSYIKFNQDESNNPDEILFKISGGYWYTFNYEEIYDLVTKFVKIIKINIDEDNAENNNDDYYKLEGFVVMKCNCDDYYYE